MTEFLAQFGPLAQDSGFEDWANILFLVVVAILWLLGGLIKAMSGKKSQQTPPGRGGAPRDQRRPGETWQERLARKAEELRRRLEEEAGLEEPQRQRLPARESASRPPQAPGGKLTVRTGPRGESIMVYERPQPQVSAQREPQVSRQREAQKTTVTAAKQQTTPKLELSRQEGFEPMISGLPPIIVEPGETLEPHRVQLKPQREPAGFEPTTLIDYSDPDALKKAVLHYEILGKPLAFRDEPERSSIF